MRGIPPRPELMDPEPMTDYEVELQQRPGVSRRLWRGMAAVVVIYAGLVLAGAALRFGWGLLG